MKILVKGIEILIDQWNLDLIQDYNWYLRRGCLQAWIDGKMHRLHRLIAERMGLDINKRIYHKNKNHLDLQQSNLTDIPPSQESIRENILIDEWNMDLIEKHSWCWSGAGYPGTTIGGKTQYLHVMIAKRMGLDCSDQIDHIDGNPLNNHESNLREATRSQNIANKKKQSNNTSGFIGVYFCKLPQKWCAQIKIKGKMTHLGLFDDKVEAAKTRDKAVLKYHGEFARLNFSDLKLTYLLSFCFSY